MVRIVTIAVAALLLAACATTSQVEDLEARIAELEATAEVAATSTTTPIARAIPGTLTTLKSRVACKWGNRQIFEGDRITISDGSGTKLAIGFLRDKTTTDDECRFSFAFPDVPTDRGFYAVELEGTGGWEFNQADIEEANWTLEFSTH